MSRRGNCHDNAVTENFLSMLKKRVISPNIYSAREDAKTESFNFIDNFYNPIRRHHPYQWYVAYKI